MAGGWPQIRGWSRPSSRGCRFVLLLDHYTDEIELVRPNGRRFDDGMSVWSFEDIAASANVTDVLSPVLAQRVTHVPEALHQRIVGNRTSAPDLFDEPVLADESPWVLGEVFEHFVGLRAQMDRFPAAQQAPALHVERVVAEHEKLLVPHWIPPSASLHLTFS
jgi:hypothetical protein